MLDIPLPKLLYEVRQVIRTKLYSIRAEETYVNWVKRFILFHHKRHPAQMGVTEVEAHLTDLAMNVKMTASTHNQALSALIFLGLPLACLADEQSAQLFWELSQ